MTRSSGKTHDAEMRKDETNRNPSGTNAKRFQANDSPGASSSRGRNAHGAERKGSASSGRGGAGNPSGAATHIPPDYEPENDDDDATRDETKDLTSSTDAEGKNDDGGDEGCGCGR